MAEFSLRTYYDGLEEDLKKEVRNWNYNRHPFYDHIAEFGDVLKETVVSTDEDGNQYVRHERFDGVVFQEGTPLAADSVGRVDMDKYMLSLWVRELDETLQNLLLIVGTLLGRDMNNLPYNTHFLSARNINVDVRIIEGWYDEVNGRGVV